MASIPLRPKINSYRLVSVRVRSDDGGGGGGGDGGGGELLTRPYPLKVQAYPPRYQRPALPSRVSGQHDWSRRAWVVNDRRLA